MMDFMRNMLATIKGMTGESINGSANFRLSVIVIRELAQRLNMTESLAAELVGAMTIKVDDDAYWSDPELFNEMAVEVARVAQLLFIEYRAVFDENVAHAYIRTAVPSMSITYG